MAKLSKPDGMYTNKDVLDWKLTREEIEAFVGGRDFPRERICAALIHLFELSDVLFQNMHEVQQQNNALRAAFDEASDLLELRKGGGNAG